MNAEGKSIFQNVVVLSVTEILAAMFSIFLMMIVARKLGPEMMGIYAFGVTFVMLVQIIVDFGLTTYIQREIGRRPDQASIMLNRIFVFKLFIYTAALIVILGLTPWLAPDYPKNAVVLILIAAMFFKTNIQAVCAFFRARHMAHLEAIVRVGIRLVYTLVGIGVVWSGFGLVPLVSIELIVHILALILAVRLFHRRIARLTLGFSLKGVIDLAKAAWNFLLINVAQTVFNSIDVLMLSLLSGDRSTGYYSSALKLSEAFDPIPNAFGGAFLPVLSRYALTDRGEFHRIFNPYFRYLVLAGAGLAAVLIAQSREIVILIYGNDFIPAAATLKILAVALVITYANWSLSMAIFALDKEKAILKAFALCAAANILMNLWLIPRYAELGAAWATAASQLLFLSLQCSILGREFIRSVKLPVLALGPLAALVLTYLLITYISGYGWGLAFNLAGGFVGFIAISLLTRSVRIGEIQMAVKYIIAGKKRKKNAV